MNNNHENLTTWQGLKIEDHAVGKALGDPAAVAHRLRTDWEADPTFLDLLADFVTRDETQHVTTLVIGAWHGDDSGMDSADVVQALAAAHKRLPKLRHLFLGDIAMEENEMSWIEQSDVSPLFNAFPELQTLIIRGGNGLSLGKPEHAHLKSLHIQTGGMPVDVLHEIANATLPALEDLELWLGEENYGGGASPEDVSAVIAPGLFPRLTRLGLKNAENQDEIVGMLAASPILKQIKHLDIGMGSLTDDGARALLAGDLSHLESLTLDHHFVGDEMVEKLKAAVPSVSAEDQQEPYDWGGEARRFIAVSE
jgi:hypothetical protein